MHNGFPWSTTSTPSKLPAFLGPLDAQRRDSLVSDQQKDHSFDVCSSLVAWMNASTIGGHGNVKINGEKNLALYGASECCPSFFVFAYCRGHPKL